MSQVDFADQIGVNRSTVNQWLGGSKRPNLGQVFAVGDFLGCTGYRLFGRLPAGGDAAVHVLAILDGLAEVLRAVVPDEWDESELRAWAKYETKRKKRADRKSDDEATPDSTEKPKPGSKRKRKSKKKGG